MNNFERWKEGEKRRIDNLTIDDLIYELTNTPHFDFCCYCANYNSCGNSCSEGLREYFTREE